MSADTLEASLAEFEGAEAAAAEARASLSPDERLAADMAEFEASEAIAGERGYFDADDGPDESEELGFLRERVNALEGELQSDREARALADESGELQAAIDRIAPVTTVGRDVIERQLIAAFMTDDRFRNAFESRHDRRAAYDALVDEIGESLPQRPLSSKREIASAIHASRRPSETPRGYSGVNFSTMTDDEFNRTKLDVFAAHRAGNLE